MVIGGGVVGLAVALTLVDAGRSVTVADPAALGENASGIAAGMLAPASEALEGGGATFERLKRARDLWPALADRIGCGLDRSGAWRLTPAGRGGEHLAALHAVGASARIASPPDWIEEPARWDCVHVADDWRIEVRLALESLRAAFEAGGGRWLAQSVAPADLGPLTQEAEVVLAAGWSARLFAAAVPELGRLSPIKGQILRLDSPPHTGGAVRIGATYVAPGAGGAFLGATMEVGVSDTRLEPSRLDALQASGAVLSGDLGRAPRRGAAAVRAATPDGWPLVGPSSSPQVWLAVGVRRNGWLLAPLVAELVTAFICGGEAHDDAAVFHPRRFDRADEIAVRPAARGAPRLQQL